MRRRGGPRACGVTIGRTCNAPAHDQRPHPRRRRARGAPRRLDHHRRRPRLETPRRRTPRSTAASRRRPGPMPRRRSSPRCAPHFPRTPSSATRSSRHRLPRREAQAAPIAGSSIRSTAGPTSFTGFPYYAVSIALTDGRDITHAVVHDPHPRRAVHGDPRQGRAAERGADPRLGLHGTRARRSSAPCSRARKSRGCRPTSAVFGDLVPRCAGIRRAGACALDLAHVAAGPARRLLGDEPGAVGRRRRRADRRAKRAAASAISPAAANSCAPTK